MGRAWPSLPRSGHCKGRGGPGSEVHTQQQAEFREASASGLACTERHSQAWGQGGSASGRPRHRPSANRVPQQETLRGQMSRSPAVIQREQDGDRGWHSGINKSHHQNCPAYRRTDSNDALKLASEHGLWL